MGQPFVGRRGAGQVVGLGGVEWSVLGGTAATMAVAPSMAMHARPPRPGRPWSVVRGEPGRPGLTAELDPAVAVGDGLRARRPSRPTSAAVPIGVVDLAVEELPLDQRPHRRRAAAPPRRPRRRPAAGTSAPSAAATAAASAPPANMMKTKSTVAASMAARDERDPEPDTSQTLSFEPSPSLGLPFRDVECQPPIDVLPGAGGSRSRLSRARGRRSGRRATSSSSGRPKVALEVRRR